MVVASNTSEFALVPTIIEDHIAPAAPLTPDLDSTSDSGTSSQTTRRPITAPLHRHGRADSLVTIYSDGVAVGSDYADDTRGLEHQYRHPERRHPRHHGHGHRRGEQHQRPLGRPERHDRYGGPRHQYHVEAGPVQRQHLGRLQLLGRRPGPSSGGLTFLGSLDGAAFTAVASGVTFTGLGQARTPSRSRPSIWRATSTRRPRPTAGRWTPSRPAVSASSPANNTFVRQTISLKATASDANLDHVEFFVDGSDRGAGTLGRRPLVVLAGYDCPGRRHRIWFARAIDKAANSADTSGLTIKVDNTAPTVP